MSLIWVPFKRGAYSHSSESLRPVSRLGWPSQINLGSYVRWWTYAVPDCPRVDPGNNLTCTLTAFDLGPTLGFTQTTCLPVLPFPIPIVSSINPVLGLITKVQYHAYLLTRATGWLHQRQNTCTFCHQLFQLKPWSHQLSSSTFYPLTSGSGV